MCPYAMPGRFSGFRAGFRVGRAGVAQLVEHLICNQRVRGSNPFASSSIWFRNAEQLRGAVGTTDFFPEHSIRNFSKCGVLRDRFSRAWCLRVLGTARCHTTLRAGASPGEARRSLMGNDRRLGVFAQVGEWLKPADCKSAPPCEVRRFESFPVHQ